MKSLFFASTKQNHPLQETHSLAYTKGINQAIEALLTDIYCCPHMRMCMPC